jgi:hypothetical protein
MDKPAPSVSPAPPSRTARLERLEQLKGRLTELSLRNMETAVRILRAWLADKKT